MKKSKFVILGAALIFLSGCVGDPSNKALKEGGNGVEVQSREGKVKVNNGEVQLIDPEESVNVNADTNSVQVQNGEESVSIDEENNINVKGTEGAVSVDENGDISAKGAAGSVSSDDYDFSVEGE